MFVILMSIPNYSQAQHREFGQGRKEVGMVLGQDGVNGIFYAFSLSNYNHALSGNKIYKHGYLYNAIQDS